MGEVSAFSLARCLRVVGCTAARVKLRTAHATANHPHMIAYTSALLVQAVAPSKVVEHFVEAQEPACMPVEMHVLHAFLQVILPRQTL